MAVDEPLTHMTIFPERSEIKDVAKLLLALADSPRDVATTLDPTMGFRIPWWLYEVFVTTWDSDETVVTSADASVTEVAEDGTETVEPVKRKPGRPRKEVK